MRVKIRYQKERKVVIMIQPVKKAIARRQRKPEHARCACCGRPGTTDRPLMFVADTNRYWHYPECMPAAAHNDDLTGNTQRLPSMS